MVVWGLVFRCGAGGKGARRVETEGRSEGLEGFGALGWGGGYRCVRCSLETRACELWRWVVGRSFWTVERVWWNGGGGVLAKKKKSKRFFGGWNFEREDHQKRKKVQFSFFCK